MTPTKHQIARRLRTLANRMTDVAADIDYYGGLAEWAQHGKELAGAAAIAHEWADAIDADGRGPVNAKPPASKKAAKQPGRKRMEHSDYPTRSDFGGALRWGFFGLALLTILGFALHVLGVIGTVATAPGRVVSQTLGTDNIIASYEWFYDANAQYESRRGQIKAHSGLIAGEQDAKERSRLNVELSAMRQSCRDLATKYNANSEKANKSLFKSRGLPESLSINQCEV